MSFLAPHSEEALLKRLDAERDENYKEEKWGHAQHRSSGSDTPYRLNNASFPLMYHPYPLNKELRMDVREWTQYNKCVHQGTHFPLCIKLGAVCRWSQHKQQ